MKDLIDLIEKRLNETICKCGAPDNDYKAHSTTCMRALFIWLIETEEGEND